VLTSDRFKTILVSVAIWYYLYLYVRDIHFDISVSTINIFMKGLVLFDLDGVIIDSKDNMQYAWQSVNQVFNLKISFNEYFKYIGIPFKDILTQLKITKNHNNIEKLYKEKSFYNKKSITFYAGIIDALTHLTQLGYTLGIVTSKDQDRVNDVIQPIGHLIDYIETPCKDLKGKPHPDHILRIIEASGISKDKAVYIGDMYVDCLAATKAEIKFFHAKWGYGEVNTDNIVIESIECLVPNIQKYL
jgi:HAD superfamily hydrolase (TIGR01549 family)